MTRPGAICPYKTRWTRCVLVTVCMARRWWWGSERGWRLRHEGNNGEGGSSASCKSQWEINKTIQNNNKNACCFLLIHHLFSFVFLFSRYTKPCPTLFRLDSIDNYKWLAAFLCSLPFFNNERGNKHWAPEDDQSLLGTKSSRILLHATDAQSPMQPASLASLYVKDFDLFIVASFLFGQEGARSHGLLFAQSACSRY